MWYIKGKQLRDLYRRMKFRRWIRDQLQQTGGDEYIERLEVDIGVEPGHFRRELEKGLLRERKARGSYGAAGPIADLPPILATLRKT